MGMQVPDQEWLLLTQQMRPLGKMVAPLVWLLRVAAVSKFKPILPLWFMTLLNTKLKLVVGSSVIRRARN